MNPWSLFLEEFAQHLLPQMPNKVRHNSMVGSLAITLRCFFTLFQRPVRLKLDEADQMPDVVKKHL